MKSTGYRHPNRMYWPALILALALGPCLDAAAQDSGSGDSSTITFSASRMESVLAKGSEKTILIGTAVVNTGSMEIKADRIELSGEDYDRVVCTGSVVVNDAEKGFMLESGSLDYTRSTEIGLAEGEVVLQDSKNDVLLKAAWVRFDQKQSLVDARVGVHILKEDFAVRSEFARFNRETENLQLSGNPVAVTQDGRVEADTITGTAGADSLSFGGRVSGTITSKKKEGTSP